MIELAAGFLVGLLVGSIKRAGRGIDRDAAYIVLLNRQKELKDAARHVIDRFYDMPVESTPGASVLIAPVARLESALNEQRGK